MIPMRQVFGDALCEAGKLYPRLVVLDADVSSSTQTLRFAQAFPERFYNFGIAELSMTAAAAGFAACGDVPVVSSFAFLLALRAGDAVRSLIAYNRLNVKLAGGYAGLSDYADGASHQSVADLSILRAIPNLCLLSPSDIESTRGAVRAMLDMQGPVYLRLSRAEVGSLHGGDERFDIGKARLLRDGGNLLVCATGPVLAAALQAADQLRSEGIACAVLEYGTIKPFDAQALLSCAARTGRVLTVEENNVIGGLGGAAAESLAEAGLGARLFRVGIGDCFGESGAYDLLLRKHGLDREGIARAMRRALADN
ncbi:MAG TPA: transketolase C-terminal domain-containing protein [Clostridia bacterium]|nr:transketolase C-terminal domain-containing protein [Clostridia bacterium]